MFATINNELSILFSTSRINRLRYAAYLAYSMVAMLVTIMIFVLIGSLFIGVHEATRIIQNKYTMVIAMILYFGFWIWLTRRRLNDSGRSLAWLAKYLLLASFIMFAPISILTMTYLNEAANHSTTLKLLVMSSYVVSLFILAYISVVSLYISKGTKGGNKYGDAPPANNKFIVVGAILYFLIVGLDIQGAMHAEQEQEPVAATDTVNS